MKLTKHVWILWGISLGVVLALAFLIPFLHTPAYWVGLAGIVVMFALSAGVFYRAFRRGEKLESKLLGWPIFRVALVGLLVQVLVGFILMTSSGLCPLWGALLAEILIFAGVLSCLTVQDAAREAVAQGEAAVVDQTKAWKAIRAKAAALAARTGAPELKKLAEDIRYADPMPTELDAQIAAQLEMLESYAGSENIMKAAQLVEQRKYAAKLGK